ncbi:glycosyltransferase family 2 protein [Methylocella sp. CPCC 101449]|uniref:glycosyltransferase family 2 protein n=1 Tax=Methylocella sp. CPCC 101449 TaxID=2987531 RepID=UPI00288EC2EF|nr:glycosyltransferase family 2 protein [Methylocella sp. CPCC 101449]MDT2019454.1 glycosyltransferase family 2 protein [Methylocella sp. CPCC 101449]
MPEFDPLRLFSSANAPDYVVTVMQEYMTVTFETLKVSSGHSGTDNPIVISVVRNENERLPDFLQHYRQAGIEKFVFLDNGSKDGTPEYLAAQPDVDLYRCPRPFNWMKKHGWINLLVTMYGRNRWFIYADGDEHLVFDGIENGRTFADISRIMDGKKIRRVRGFLLDMYADGPLLKSDYKRGERLIEAYSLFDSVGYKEEKYKEIISRKGGPRQRAFSKADQNFRPEMTKYPMFRLEGHDVFANPHHIWPYQDNFKSDCYFGILHFKFLPDVIHRIEAAISEKNYWGDSIEYKCYHKILTDAPNLSLRNQDSAVFKNADILIDKGLINRL